MKTLTILSFILAFSLKCFSQYTITTPVTGLNQGIAFVITPDDRFIVTQKGGTVKVFSSSGSLLSTFWNNTSNTESGFEQGLLGVALDPEYNTNHWVYFYYCHLNPKSFRVVRLEDSSNVGINLTTILNIPHGTINGNHVGGNIRFRPSTPDKIYVTIGEIAVPANSQLLTNPFGKILRINKDGTIPTDNPFYDDGNTATGNDDRIWEYGHRNAFDFTFSDVNDSLYVSENGSSIFDELNLGTKGKNYGWQTCEGNYVYPTTNNPCNIAGLTNPIYAWGAPLPAVTGVLHVTSSLFPELQNHLLVADNNNGKIYNLTLNAPAYSTVASSIQWLDLVSGSGLTTLMQGNDGAIYALNGGYINPGKIFRIVPDPLTAIQTSPISSNTICAADFFDVSFTTTGTANINNQFNVQLSNKNGNFSAPAIIGSLNSPVGGTITCATSVFTNQGLGYRIRVVSTDPAIIGSNNGSNITIYTYCQKPTGVSSGNITSSSALLSWNPEFCNHATGYRVRYRIQGATQWTTVNASGTSKQLNNLSGNSTYEYAVKSKCGVTNSGWTTIQTFTTMLRLVGNESQSHQPILNIFPNPASQDAIITIQNIPSDAEGEILFSNMYGQIEKAQKIGLSKGSNQITVSLEGLTAGIYLMRVLIDDKELQQLLVVQE